MTNRTAAARYARALFDVSVQDRDLRQVEADLAACADLIDGHDTLSRVLLNPAIPTPRKRAVVDALVGQIGDIAPPVARLLRLLAERDRVGLLPQVLRFYRARVLDHQGVIEAQVTTAQPLTPERAAAIRDEFGKPVRPMMWEQRGSALANAALLVNTTSLGMEGQPPLDIDLGKLPENAVVYDIVYVPLETPLLAAARARGNPAIDGLGMLLHQARPGFREWFGTDPTVDQALRDHVLADL